MILRARTVLPIARPPIENGAVAVAGNRIQCVGRWSKLKPPVREEVVDLGEVILLPGLINSHCHLDYTDLAGKIPPPKSFADWLKALVALKAQMTRDDFARSWQRGAQMLLHTGTTTVADVEALPELIPQMWASTPLRVLSFREIICLKPDPAASQAVHSAVTEWSALPMADGRIGLSPHTPYTTTPRLLQLAARVATQRHWRLVTHVAESEQELEMFMYRHGALYDWLKDQRDMSDCGGGSPIHHLETCGYLSARLVAVHANYLARDDARRLGKHRVSVVHCPRSHAYFRHLVFPRDELTAHGVNLCLGTDSLASSASTKGKPAVLNMFAEMSTLAAAAPDLAAATILKMATVQAAKALGRERQLGQLSEDALADLIVIRFKGRADNLYEAVIHHTGPVNASMIDGQWAIPPGP